jgi:hypothetical protein
MSASAHSSAEGALSSSGGVAAAGSAAAPARGASGAADDGSLPVVGSRWRGKYDIDAQLSDAEGVLVWRGRGGEAGHEVVLRAWHPTEPAVRAQAWSKLGGIDSPYLQHPRDAQRAGDWRVEIADAVPGLPLHEWRAARQIVDPAKVKAIVGQLADALGALHAFELVHLNLRPECIFVEDQGADVQCRIAGLDALTSFDRMEPLPAAVDPFYAPPEAVGLNVHVAGPGLCAWDWWSLGRVVQELILGRHIVAQLANVPGRPLTPELRSRAEGLLFEADPKGPRAGAVELMPGLDPQTLLLLRGLLTSAKEARWTGDNVDRWLRALPVKEHYATVRADTHFRWRGRPCTVPEIAMLLQSAEHWPENSVQLFEPTTPGTLAHFLKWSPTQSAAHEQLTSALELAEALPLKLSSPAAQREAVTTVALLQLSAAQLIWRGRTFDHPTIVAMLNELGAADGLMVLRALSTRSTALQIERIDAAAGRLLTELGRTTSDAESILRRHSWLGSADVEGSAQVFRLALEPLPGLREAREKLGQSFAGSDHPAMDKLFKLTNPGRLELVVLAWAGAAPERFKFFTHGEAARRRAEALRARGVELVAALTWVQFEQALRVGAVVLAGWGAFALTWFVVGVATALLWPGPIGCAYALVPALVAFGFRLLLAPREQRALRTCVPDAHWTWRDGPPRCRRELRLAGRGLARAALVTELETVTKELVALKDVKPAPAPLPPLPRFPVVRAAGIASWVLLAFFVGAGAWRVRVHPLSAKDLKAAWVPAAQAKKPATEAVTPKTAADDKAADVKVSWPYKAAEAAVKVPVTATQAATKEQAEFAQKHGRDLVAPYRPETIGTLVVMPVPAGDDVAVMLFDGKRGELYNDQVYLLSFSPIPRTIVEISGRRGVFLDQ